MGVLSVEEKGAGANVSQDCLPPEPRLQQILELESCTTKSSGFYLCPPKPIV